MNFGLPDVKLKKKNRFLRILEIFIDFTEIVAFLFAKTENCKCDTDDDRCIYLSKRLDKRLILVLFLLNEKPFTLKEIQTS